MRRARGTVAAGAVALTAVLCAGASARDGARAAAPPALDRFDERRAFAFLRYQVGLGPRPAGSAASRRLAARLRTELPAGRYQAVPGGLRNVVGVLPGRDPRRRIVVGAHYDTKEMRGFVGANDGASGVAVVVELARTLRPRTLGPTVVFVLFDGEESPAGATDFLAHGLRGSKVAARAFRDAEAMILLDMVGDRQLRIPREAYSDEWLWSRLRRAARRAGTLEAFPRATSGGILDDHIPFARVGVPAIDVIDFEFPCWHRTCDDLTAVSPRSLDLVGETMVELLRSF